MALTDKLTAIADAIRSQSGKTAKLTLAQMPAEIIDLQSLNFNVEGGTTYPLGKSKNLIVYPFHHTTQTVSGITWTDNGDGTITANGTATADSSFRLSYHKNDTTQVSVVPAGTYRLSGCPTGGATSTYFIEYCCAPANKDWGSSDSYGNDVGSGTTVTTTAQSKFRLRCVVMKGTKVTNLVFKPQMEAGSSATSFAKYDPLENIVWVNTSTAVSSWDFSSSQPLRRSKSKNLNVYPYVQTTHTDSGITWTDNGDGAVKANGTCTATDYFRCQAPSYPELNFNLPAGTYTISCSNTSDGVITYEAILTYGDGSTKTYICKGSPVTFTTTKDATVRSHIKVYKGATLSNITLNPQVEKGSSATSFVKGDATGHVWITSGASGPAEFNALKKNGIMLQPLSAKQYNGSSWVDKTIKIYAGKWVGGWNGDLYKAGDEVTSITGGWQNMNTNASGYSLGTMTKNSSTIYLNTNKNQRSFVTPVNRVNLTGFNTLTVVMVGTGCSNFNSSIYRLFGVYNETPTESNAVAYTAIGKAGTYSINVSSLSGAYMIGLLQGDDTNNGDSAISEVYLR